MTTRKRLFDLVFALGLLPFLVPVAALVAIAVALVDGLPVIYGGERVGQGGRSFVLWKFRTMLRGDAAGVASGGHMQGRITALGYLLRRSRLDELPQIVNVLRGEMSFVGPRPPLRRYVDLCPDLYAQVLRQRPGITGLATVLFRRREEAVMAACQSPQDSDACYRRHCLPHKARLDRLYARRQGLRLDLAIIAMTLASLGPGPGPGRLNRAVSKIALRRSQRSVGQGKVA